MANVEKPSNDGQNDDTEPRDTGTKVRRKCTNNRLHFLDVREYDGVGVATTMGICTVPSFWKSSTLQNLVPAMRSLFPLEEVELATLELPRTIRIFRPNWSQLKTLFML